MCDLEADGNLISPNTFVSMYWAQVGPKSEDGFWCIINKMIDILYTGIKGSINGQLDVQILMGLLVGHKEIHQWCRESIVLICGGGNQTH